MLHGGRKSRRIVRESEISMIDIGFEPLLEPKPYRVPLCPACGAETDTIIRDRYGRIVGCRECVEEIDAWENEHLTLEREVVDEI